MSLDYATLDSLRNKHPAWRLLSSPHASLIISFFNKVFVSRNRRIAAQADLIEALEDELFALREQLGADRFPRSALDYLNDWAAPEKGWLRKFYRQQSDEVQFDLTPSAEKAIRWLESLSKRQFVGTESRLLMLFDLLKQLDEGSRADPGQRLKELQKRRAEIDREIAQVVQGNINVLDETALKDRFMQFSQQARELLSDFREVEYNFRQLDRRVRERIAQWDGQKGELLEAIMGERDVIADSDQGNSFRAFWDFLMSPERQEQFSEMLEQVLQLPAIEKLNPDKRIQRVHYDWLEAGEHTQRTVALLSQQLRRFLDDQAWLENRRIMDILRGIENKSLEMREDLLSTRTAQDFMWMDELCTSIELPMEKPLYKAPVKLKLADIQLQEGDEQIDTSALFSQVVVDKVALARHIRQSLQNRTQVTLTELCRSRPLQLGLAELLAYLELGGEQQGSRQMKMVVDETVEECLQWKAETETGETTYRKVRLPRIIFLAKH